MHKLFPFFHIWVYLQTQPLLGLSLAWQVAPRVKLSLDYDETRFKVYTTHGSLRMFGLAAQFAF